MSNTIQPQIIACTLSAGELVTRGERWRQLTERAALGIAPTERGLRMVFRNATDVEHELHELATLERDCCAFAAWDVSREDEKLYLDVTAEGEAVTAVQAMFGNLRARLAPA